MSRFLCWWLPDVSVCSALSGVRSGVSGASVLHKYGPLTSANSLTARRAEGRVLDNLFCCIRSTAAVYFELDPEQHIGTHMHSAEEILFVLEGEMPSRP
jgi:hypothetical protein